MTSLYTDGGLNAFFRKETAHEVHHKIYGTSLGKEKLRCDLVDWVYDAEDKKDLISNQFCIAMEEDHFVDEKVAKDKTGWFRVAVRVTDKNFKTHRYAILNLASLSKRLEVSEADLKKQEQSTNGIDAAYIKEKLEAQIAKQKHMLNEIHTYESTTDSRDNKAMLEKMEPFINEEFPEDRVLQKKLSDWRSNRKLAKSPKYNENKAKIDAISDEIVLSICRNVKSKLCVASTDDHRLKTAINTTNPLQGSYWATDGKGKEKSLHLRLLNENEDPDGKYSIEIKPFVYSSRPTPTSEMEVPLKLPDKKGWVMASVKSLKWLNLTEDPIRELSKRSEHGKEMSRLDFTIMQKLEQISKEIKEGQLIKQQLADAHPNPIHPSMSDQKATATKLINNLYDRITAPNANKRPITLEALQEKCEKTIEGSVEGENAIVSVLLLGAHDCDARKLRIVWDKLMSLVEEEWKKIPDREQFRQLSNLDRLKYITSLNTILIGQTLKGKCNALSLKSDEVSSVRLLNANPEFNKAVGAFLSSIFKNIQTRLIQQKSNSFNVKTFTNLVELAQNVPVDVVMKAAIFEAAKTCNDIQLGIIVEWFMSSDFQEWVSEQSEYLSLGPSGANILKGFKMNIDQLLRR